jgi:hypothetical protein
VRTLVRRELTAALAARQMLLERRSVSPAEAVRRLTPLQGQHPPAPFIALAARVEGLERGSLEAAIEAGQLVKATLMRQTLHLAAADDLPAYATLWRQPWLRKWRGTYAHLDEERVIAELREFLSEPRTNPEIREHVGLYDGVPADQPWAAVLFARTLLPLVQLSPAGFWDGPRMAQFVVDPRPQPSLEDAAAVAIARYLAAFGPAARRDVASWSGVPQRDFGDAWERVETVSYRDEEGRELIDLPGAPLPPGDTPLPVRFLAHWDQALLAYADRDRIIPPEILPLKLTLSGDPTVTVDGRVAASWAFEDGRVTVTPHVDLSRAARAAIREEGLRTARFCTPEAASCEVVGV